MVSLNHETAASAFREQPEPTQPQSSNGRLFWESLLIVNSGYRTQYPLVVAATIVRVG